MDIKGTNSQNSADSLEQLKQLKANFLGTAKADTNSDNEQDTKVTDSCDSEAFSSLKAKVSQAKQAGRAEYISQLKESIASGAYNVSSSDLADALIADGVGEFLVS